MKTRYLIVLLTLILVSFRAEALNDTLTISSNDTMVVICAEVECPKDSIQVQSCCRCEQLPQYGNSLSYSDGISTLTLVVNTINNLYTRDGIFIALISLAIAILGYIGHRKINKAKEDQEELTNTYKKEVDKAVAELQVEANSLKAMKNEIKKTQTLNNQYLKSINQWILNDANAIAQATGGNLGQDLLQQSTLNYYLMKLFLSKDKHEIDHCINYIKNKGSKEVLEHLKFIVDNDPDEYKRNKANEAIGYIKRGIP